MSRPAWGGWIEINISAYHQELNGHVPPRMGRVD